MTDLQIEADLNDLTDAAAAMFGAVPFKDYTFFVKVQPTSGATSVGYLNSARIVVGENDFVAQNSYSAFLSVAAQATDEGVVHACGDDRGPWTLRFVSGSLLAQPLVQ